jgi:ABC-type nitrate/sulfonate/bicarbonate transport system substrate-binding protein
VKVGFTPDPLVQGQCDAYTCYVTNQPLSLAEKGIEHLTVTYDAMGYKAYGNILFAKRDYLEKNRDLLVGYLRATIKGWEENELDPAVGARHSVDIYGKDLGLSLDQQIAENEAQIELTKSELTDRKGLFWIDKETVAGPMYDALRASGLAELPDIDRFVDTSLLEDAYAGKTKLT